ncbi:ATP-binding region ATPase domain protein [Candidatus Moduliflexus flocculans]|uniref:ATP-binding region ATPase domain protein n=1 Tax=Candidatus Moduliflexus flocculans TaxID=1499966 RepID=A0A0S6VTI7_9BACT|nr:ATP-binding region ATPase domain protein [Candidatus Moduliflexus flocculans]
MQAAQIIADAVGQNRPTIGFIIPEVTSQVNSQIWCGAVDAAQAFDVNLLGFAGYELERPDGFKAQGNILYDLICAENVAGLVLWTNSLSNFAGSDAAKKLYTKFPAVPMVELESSTTPAESYSYRGTGTLIRHLIDAHARRRIAFIRGPQGHQEAEHRYRAYCDALQTAQLSFEPTRVVLADNWFEPSGKKAICTLLDQQQATFDAVVAANDLLAIGALQELQFRGIRVPKDVVVTGFDDILDAQYSSPPLTTIRYPLYEMGWQAVEAVAAQITGRTFIRTPFPVQLQIRQSCGCLSQTVVRVVAENISVTDECERALVA